MRPGQALAEAATSLIGTPFRLHGRDPATGLDCIGLVTCALARSGLPAQVPATYTLRNSAIETWLPHAARSGLVPASGVIGEGDIVLVRTGPAQCHLLVALGEDDIVHAHAGLRRVVRQPRPSGWPILHHWRLDPTREET